ncbi:MAG: nuclear transport factor 2 family protein [Flavobacterium sp.]|nr:MAG: nuclear transport factor 2 family protein [Flavobacterium sp.]
MEKQIKDFLTATNAFDVDMALNLFTKNAIIDDVSVGKKFENSDGIRDYIERYFVGYNTKTKLKDIKVTGTLNARTKVDFTGNFGYEKGVLDFTFNKQGLIERIDADLE